MENAVDALKIAFAVMIFAMALTLSISSFSNASQAIDAIIQMRDRENEYTYVEPSANLTRNVGIETVIATMYRAIEQNLEIKFFDKVGNTIPLYYKVDDYGNKGDEVSSIDFGNYDNGKYTNPKEFLNMLLGGDTYDNTVKIWMHGDYKTKGFYGKFKSNTFEEKLGEYIDEGTKMKKRVITYTLRD